MNKKIYDDFLSMKNNIFMSLFMLFVASMLLVFFFWYKSDYLVLAIGLSSLFFIGFHSYQYKRRYNKLLSEQRLDFQFQQNQDLPTAVSQPVSELLTALIPIWEKNIRMADQQAEVATQELSARFVSIVNRLGIDSGHSNQDERTVMTTLSSCEATVDEVLSRLRETHEGRRAIMNQIESLTEHTSQLQSMTDQVSKIAEQTNLLALNASIESARAGEAGRGFSVVAQEVRSLSQQSKDTALNIAENVKAINLAIETTKQTTASTVKAEVQAVDQADQGLQSVLSSLQKLFSEISEKSNQLQIDATDTRLDIEQMMIDMQFQDRVSQILLQIANIMAEVLPNITAHKNGELSSDELLNVDDWLVKMESSYTMDEQRHDQKSKSAVPAADEITFF